MSDVDSRLFTKKSSDGILKKLSLCLPVTVGPLSKEVPSSWMNKANEKVQAICFRKAKRGPYQMQSLPAKKTTLHRPIVIESQCWLN